MPVNNRDSVDIVLRLIDIIQKNKDYLGEIDGAIGDGDHGINMNKGFTMAGERIRTDKVESFSEGLSVLGDVLLMDIGGSMGPLYGTFFGEMSESIAPVETFTREDFGRMIEAGLAGIQSLSTAKVGDKSLMDCLVPACEAYRGEADKGSDFETCLRALQKAADEGWENTKDMVAMIGRASRLGERSRGTYDAGATSCHLILQSLSQSFLEKLSVSA